MKNVAVHSYREKKRSALFFVLLWLPVAVFSVNPPCTNFLKNLSSAVNAEPLDDVAAEMQRSGNTLHVVWIEYKYGAENSLYYCRSTNLGDTWETPRLIGKLKDSQYATQPTTRKLAVDGNNVHIAWCDYAYYENGTGRIYYTHSTDGGSSFATVREVISTGGGYRNIAHSQVKAAKGKVAIAYRGSGAVNGLRILFSPDNGNAFTDKLITEEPDNLTDFWYDGQQMILVSEYIYYYFGLNIGKVFVSVSNDDAATFGTQKISTTYQESETITREKCRCYHDVHYSPKIAKSGNTIHVIFAGYNEKIQWTTLYARSTDNGVSFEKAIDINNAVLNGNYMQSGQETLAAKNGHVYICYLGTNGRIYFSHSENNGNTFSAAEKLLPEGFSFIESTWWPSLVTDPNDETGEICYLTGNTMFSYRTTNGGKSFDQAIVAAPFLNSNLRYMLADMLIDAAGNKHWIAESMFKGGTDHDIFYKSIKPEPQPGTTNKALSIKTVIFDKFETVMVPSSLSLNFDSAMTAEAWIKFDPASEHEINILGKVNGYDGYDYAPNGYQFGFRKSNGKFCINSGLETDKGDFVNWGDCSIADTLWHHVAFTYDANAGLNNFKTYVDGLLSVQQTVTGKIIPGNGLLLIGSRQAFYGTTNYQLDNIRLWSRALSQDELLENQVKSLTGNEDSLRLFLNFDDTFRDLSGHGNDAIPLHLGILKNSGFNPPIPKFDTYQSINQVSLTNKSENGKTYFWKFGDTSVSDKGNPVYTYPAPGEYTISLEALNDNSKTAAIMHVSIAGLDHVEPRLGGNYGHTIISVFGGGLTVTGTTVLLRKAGSSDLIGENLSSPAGGVLSAQFNLTGAAIGKWDVLVKKGSAEQVLEKGFEIAQAEMADPWVSISGRGAILINGWQAYTLTYGNNGNVDAYSVPVWLAISETENLEVEFIDFNMVVSDLATQNGIAPEIRDIGPYFSTETVLGEPMKARVYPFMIPVIRAKSTASIHVRIRTKESIKMKLWANPPWLETALEKTNSSLKNAQGDGQGSKLQAAECVMGVLAEGIVDIGTSAIPGVGCLWSAGKWGYQIGSTPPWDKKFSIMNTLWNTGVTVVDCGINLSGVGAIAKGIGVFFANMAGYANSISQCNELAKPNSGQEMSVRSVSSFDPNEMIGPAGSGDEHWIQKNSAIPYVVLFENKSTATAPAHTVVVTDTLDLSKFDIAEFGFGAFGFGDTTLTPNGQKLREFSMDIDLRPGMQLLARVSGKLDTLSGVIRWEFRSLNPETLQEEDDPFTGFLPPNDANHAGEGFVSFSVGIRSGLKTNDVLANQASIVFDANDPIITNEYRNKLDLDKPESQIFPLDATNQNHFTLAWSGSDHGSGIAGYTIYVMENDTALRVWRTNTAKTSDEFVGNVNSSYKFYSIATDRVSLREDTPDQFDATTQIVVHAREFELLRNKLEVFPNPADDQLRISIKNAPCGMYVVELVSSDGRACYSRLHDDYQISGGLVLDVTGFRPGQYVLRVVYGNQSESRKVMIR